MDSQTDRKRILLVEDDDDMRAMLEATLKAHGYIVDSASNAHDGLTLGKPGKHALAIVDLRLPGQDGAWFVDTLHERLGPDGAPPAIFLTVLTDREYPEVNEHVITVLPKSAPLERLLEVVSRHAR